MSGKHKLFFWIGGSTLLLISFATLSAAPGPGGTGAIGQFSTAPGPFRKMFMGRMGRTMVLRSELNMTADQRKKLVAIVKSHHDEIHPSVKSLSLAARNLRDKIVSDNPREDDIRAAASDLGKAIAETAVLASRGVGEAKAVLTSDQVTLFKNYMAENDRARDRFLDELKNLPEFLAPQ